MQHGVLTTALAIVGLAETALTVIVDLLRGPRAPVQGSVECLPEEDEAALATAVVRVAV
jgi:hypothetical protein